VPFGAERAVNIGVARRNRWRVPRWYSARRNGSGTGSAVLECVVSCSARRANQKYFVEHSVYLFSSCALIAANSGDKVVACLRAEAPSCARQDVPEVAAVRAIGVNRSQLGRAVAIEMASQVDDTGQGRRGNARSAEHQPATESLALRAVIHGNAAMRIGVEREIRSRAAGCRGICYPTLIAGFWFVFAGTASAAAPPGFVRNIPLLLR